jgi:hypothetical protein
MLTPVLVAGSEYQDSLILELRHAAPPRRRRARRTTRHPDRRRAGRRDRTSRADDHATLAHTPPQVTLTSHIGHTHTHTHIGQPVTDPLHIHAIQWRVSKYGWRRVHAREKMLPRLLEHSAKFKGACQVGPTSARRVRATSTGRPLLVPHLVARRGSAALWRERASLLLPRTEGCCAACLVLVLGSATR